jgi:hypothetical protein
MNYEETYEFSFTFEGKTQVVPFEDYLEALEYFKTFNAPKSSVAKLRRITSVVLSSKARA